MRTRRVSFFFSFPLYIWSGERDADDGVSAGQDNFVRKWDEVVKERRAQRARLMHIQEEMESSVFTGRQARDVFM